MRNIERKFFYVNFETVEKNGFDHPQKKKNIDSMLNPNV